MNVYSSKRDLIVLADDSFSSGGEGEVRKIISGPAYLKNACVKLYYQKQRTPLREKKIKYMVANPPSKVKGDGFLIGWPMDYITDNNGNFLGFAMPLAFPSSKQLINLTTTKLSKKLSIEWVNKYDRTKGKPALVSRLKLVSNISIPIHILHSTGKYVLKDFKPENVLITHSGKVTIVDMDSIQICEGSKLLFPGEVLTPNYLPPEYYTHWVGKDRKIPLEKSWDYFAIGVVFYQLLFGLHPFVVTPWAQIDQNSNEIYQNISQNLFPFGPYRHKIKSYPPLHDKFKILPKSLQDLFLRALSGKPSNRPGAQEWGKLIHSLIVNAKSSQTTNSGQTTNPSPAAKPINAEKFKIWAEDEKQKGKKFAIKRHGLTLYTSIDLLKMSLTENDEIRQSNQTTWRKLSGVVYSFIPTEKKVEPPHNEYLNVSSRDIKFGESGGTQSIAVWVDYRDTWKLEFPYAAKPSWLDIKSSKSSLNISATPNYNPYRTFSFSIVTAGGLKARIRVDQEAKNIPPVPPPPPEPPTSSEGSGNLVDAMISAASAFFLVLFAVNILGISDYWGWTDGGMFMVCLIIAVITGVVVYNKND